MWNTDILTGSSLHSKEAPVLAFRPQAGAQPPPTLPTSCRPCTWGRTSPGRDALRLVKSTRLPSLPLALRRVLFQTSQGFHSTNNCMRARGEAEKDLCVWWFYLLSSLCWPHPQPAWSFSVDLFLPKTLRKDPFSFC